MFEEMTKLIAMTEDEVVLRQVAGLDLSREMVKGRAAAIVELPPPEQAIEAFMVLIVLDAGVEADWPEGIGAGYYTLEARVGYEPGGEREGVVCGWTKDGSHLNFGRVARVERKAFVEVVEGLIGREAESATAAFRPGTGEGRKKGTRQEEKKVEAPKPPPKKKPWWKFW
jgi:hypothetical protein